MKRSCVLVLATFLIVLTTAAFAAPPDPAPPVPPQMQGPWGQGGAHPQMQGPWGHGPARHRFAAFLNLTQEQKDRMRELRSRFSADTHDLKYDIKLKRLEMRKLFTDPKTDDQTLLAQQKELSGLVLRLMDKKAQMKIEWRKILTPEQIQKLDRMPMKGGMHHGRGFGMM